MKPSIQPVLLDIGAFCQRYSIGKTKTYAEIGAGRLRTVLRGNRRFVRIEDAEAWVNSAHKAA